MSSEGWDILKQRKTYGEHVTITIDEGKVFVHVARENPLGLSLLGDLGPEGSEDPRSEGAELGIKPTREAADKIGFSISRLLEEVQNLRSHALNGTEQWPKRPDDPAGLFIDEFNRVGEGT